MPLADDLPWLIVQTNAIYERLRVLRLEIEHAPTEVQKAGHVALAARLVCEVLREVSRRGLPGELSRAVAGDIERDPQLVARLRENLERFIELEFDLLLAYGLKADAARDLLDRLRRLGSWPSTPFGAAAIGKQTEHAVAEVCEVPRLGSELLVRQTYERYRKRYGMLGGVAIAAVNAAAIATAAGADIGTLSKLAGLLIATDGAQETPG